MCAGKFATYICCWKNVCVDNYYKRVRPKLREWAIC